MLLCQCRGSPLAGRYDILPIMKANSKQEKQGASSPLSGKGFVYILKDDHFKRGVKIGRAHDVGKRMKAMRTANPWLSVYIKVETSKWMELEKAVHNVIKLVAKTKQVKDSEFYLIEPEKAKRIMLELMPLIGKEDFTVYRENGELLNPPTKTKAKPGQKSSSSSPRAKPVGLSALGIKPGAELVFEPTGVKVVVQDDRTVAFQDETYSLSGFTKKFIPNPIPSGAYQGPKYFSFKGRNLLDIRRIGASREEAGGEKWEGKTQLARLIARRGGNEGAYGGILHFFNKRKPCGKSSKWRQPLEAAGIAFDEKGFAVDWAAARNPL